MDNMKNMSMKLLERDINLVWQKAEKREMELSVMRLLQVWAGEHWWIEKARFAKLYKPVPTTKKAQNSRYNPVPLKVYIDRLIHIFNIYILMILNNQYQHILIAHIAIINKLAAIIPKLPQMIISK